MKKKILLTICVLACLVMTGCSSDGSISTQEEKQYQETLMQQANDKVGMPEITEFYEYGYHMDMLEWLKQPADEE